MSSWSKHATTLTRQNERCDETVRQPDEGGCLRQKPCDGRCDASLQRFAMCRMSASCLNLVSQRMQQCFLRTNALSIDATQQGQIKTCCEHVEHRCAYVWKNHPNLTQKFTPVHLPQSTPSSNRCVPINSPVGMNPGKDPRAQANTHWNLEVEFYDVRCIRHLTTYVWHLISEVSFYVIWLTCWTPEAAFYDMCVCLVEFRSVAVWCVTNICDFRSACFAMRSHMFGIKLGLRLRLRLRTQTQAQIQTQSQSQTQTHVRLRLWSFNCWDMGFTYWTSIA